MPPTLPRASNIEASNIEALDGARSTSGWTSPRDTGHDDMTQAQPPSDTPDTDAVAAFEGEIREFVRRDVAPARRFGADASSADLAATNINSLVHRVAGTSLQEIDSLIVELNRLRDYLAREGERVQREIADYAQLSQATMNSTKIIAESMAKWKSVMDSATRVG